MTPGVLVELRRHGYEPLGVAGKGRPDRAAVRLRSARHGSVVAKLYPPAVGRRAYHNMVELWHSSFGARRDPPGLPRPLEYLDDIGALVMENVDGRPLAHLPMQPVEGAMAILADLHSSDAAPTVKRDVIRIVRGMKRRADALAATEHEQAAPFAAAVQALERAAPVVGELVPSHGDFAPKNVLVVASGQLTLVDFDRFQLAHPARDVAYFAVAHWTYRLRARLVPDWSVLGRAIDSYYAHRPQSSLATQLEFHVAAGLLRTAYASATLRADDSHLVPRLVAEARGRLE